MSAKQVPELPQKAPATWMFPTVIPVEVSALVRTKNSELAVRLPLASKQTSCFVMPPHAPKESAPVLTLVAMDNIAFSFTFPENPITGPPSRTEPDVI